MNKILALVVFFSLFLGCESPVKNLLDKDEKKQAVRSVLPRMQWMWVALAQSDTTKDRDIFCGRSDYFSKLHCDNLLDTLVFLAEEADPIYNVLRIGSIPSPDDIATWAWPSSTTTYEINENSCSFVPNFTPAGRTNEALELWNLFGYDFVSPGNYYNGTPAVSRDSIFLLSFKPRYSTSQVLSLLDKAMLKSDSLFNDSAYLATHFPKGGASRSSQDSVAYLISGVFDTLRLAYELKMSSPDTLILHRRDWLDYKIKYLAAPATDEVFSMVTRETTSCGNNGCFCRMTCNDCISEISDSIFLFAEGRYHKGDDGSCERN